jgi:Ca-activated chloride channel family protein
MTFAVPSLLWLALLAPAAAAAAVWLWRRRLAADAAWASRGLWSRLLPAFAPRRLTLSVAALALAVLGVAFALARPRWGSGEQKVERKGVDVVFLVDSSLSMGAFDAPPSRLFVAKSLVRRMVRDMPGNRAGLVQTEGDSLVLAPLTLDGAVIDLLLDAIDPGSLPTPGTELAPGIETALRLFGQGSEKHRVLVIASDGEDWGGGLDSEIAKLKDNGVIVYALGVGTPQGTTVPIPGNPGEVKRDQDGGVVISKLNEETLEKLARATGGDYLRATSAAADPSRIVAQIDRLEKRTIESQSLSTLEERFQWPLALAVLALLVYLGVGPFLPDPLPPLPVREGGRGRERGPGGEGSRAVFARSYVLPLALITGLALPSLPWQPHLPAWVERWMYNPRERTERSIQEYKQGRAKEAVGPADTAERPRGRRGSSRPRPTTTWGTRGSRPATPPARWRRSRRPCASSRRTWTPSTTWSWPCARPRSRRWAARGTPPARGGSRSRIRTRPRTGRGIHGRTSSRRAINPRAPSSRRGRSRGRASRDSRVSPRGRARGTTACRSSATSRT